MTIQELKDLIINELGSPFHTVHLTDDQMNVLIGRALDRYREHHHESTEKDVLLLDVVAGTRKYTLPSNILTVNSYYQTNLSSVPLSLRYTKLGFMNSTMLFDIISYTVLESYSRSVDMTIDPKYSFRYNQRTNRLTFEHTPTISETWGLEVYIMTDEEDAYGDDWLQEYAVALCKYQYSWNLVKFDSTLPGSTRINHQIMMQEAKDLKRELEEELINEHSAPIPIKIG